MIYKNISKEQARKICKKFRAVCENCPLRRERKETDEKGNERTILRLCAFVLLNLPLVEEDEDLLLYEEISHEDDLKELLKSVECI